MDLEAARAYARKHALHALVVSQAGEIVAEEYDGGYNADKPHALYSGTKSFWGVAAAYAQEDGILRLDDRVGETFPAWDEDPRKRGVTLRMLLNLTAGIGFGGLGASVPAYARALAVELKNPPGEKFTYGGIPLQVFGAVFARRLEKRKKTPHTYLRERVLDPIGLKIGSWRELTDGTNPLPTGAFVAAREWLKYGQFVARGGKIIDETLHGSSANGRYGLCWWLGLKDAPSDLIYASGSGGQAMYIVPSLDVVAVHFGGSASYNHAAFCKRLFVD